MTERARTKAILAINKLAGVTGKVPEGMNLFGHGVSGDMIVDAVLLAIRVPDDAMMKVAESMIQSDGHHTFWPDSDDAFTAMIDAILNEQPQT
jgi:hypothetical protein